MQKYYNVLKKNESKSMKKIKTLNESIIYVLEENENVTTSYDLYDYEYVTSYTTMPIDTELGKMLRKAENPNAALNTF